jgi:uncharacterized membrane protein YgdD (TMEM256/DUF423 family)
VTRLAALAALLGGLGVAAGAFGAHGLRASLTPEALAWWRTGADYHLVHALAMLLAALEGARLGPGRASRSVGLSVYAFLAGIALFSGSLYLMALTDVRALGAVTPLGGTAFLIGWGALAWWLLRSRR